MNEKYEILKIYYDDCLKKHGDSHLGVDWPNLDDLFLRYNIMLDIIRGDHQETSVLDFGCGNGMLYDYMLEKKLNIKYVGLDINKNFIQLCQKKHPGTTFITKDIFKDSSEIPSVDYVLCNGTFTERISLSNDEMFLFLTSALKILFSKAKKGIAFNVMSGIVDFKNDNLYYLDHNKISEFIIKNLTRNYIIRNDYGLYEYTIYIYKEAYRI